MHDRSPRAWPPWGFPTDTACVNQLLDALMASLADAVYLVGASGEGQFANPAALAMLGYEDGSALIGRDSHATIHSRRPDGEPFPEAECPLLRPRVSGEIVRVALDWFVRRDGTLVPVSYASAPVATADGRGAVVVFRDESERVAAGGVAGWGAR